jgi:hypothetical protein
VVVGADRLAAFVTARVVANSMTTSAEQNGVTLTDARVAVHGFPFVTQLLSREMSHVTGTLAEAQMGGYRVRDVELEAWGLSPNSPWHARHIEVSTLLPYSTFENVIAEQIGASVTLGYSRTVPGSAYIATEIFGLQIGVDLEPVVTSPTRLGVRIRGVTVGGLSVHVDALPFGLADRIGAISLPLSLPSGVSFYRVIATTAGFRLTAQANDVSLATLFQ